MSVADIVQLVVSKGEQDLVDRFFTLSWAFWFRRNKLSFEQTRLEPTQVVNYALNILNILCFKKASRSVTTTKLVTNCSWHAPPAGFCILNVDGAMFYDLHKAGIGAVVRDEYGNVLLAVSKAETEVADPEAIELLAMLRGLQFCVQMGCPKLILESDSLLTVEAIQADRDSMSVLGNLVNEVKNLMKCFEVSKVQHVLRLGNKVAHQLARNAWHVSDVELWMGSIPHCISHSVWVDTIHL